MIAERKQCIYCVMLITQRDLFEYIPFWYLMLHTSFKQVGTVATKDWYGCGMLKTPVWNIRHVNWFSVNRSLHRNWVSKGHLWKPQLFYSFWTQHVTPKTGKVLLYPMSCFGPHGTPDRTLIYVALNPGTDITQSWGLFSC